MKFPVVSSKVGRLLLFTGFLAALSLPAKAGTELITNGGFENTVGATNNYTMFQAAALPSNFAAVNGTYGVNYNSTVISGWQTTSVDTAVSSTPVIEVWNGNFGVNSMSAGAYSGSQYAEMNSVSAGTLFQDIANQAPGAPLYLSFTHSDRGSDGVSSQMRVTLWDLGADGVFNSTLATAGSPNAVAHGDDSFLVNQLITATDYNASAGSANWSIYNYSTAATTSNRMLLTFQSVVGGGSGNFLDNVSLNTTSIGAPEPSSLCSMLGGGAWLAGALLRRRRAI